MFKKSIKRIIVNGILEASERHLPQDGHREFQFLPRNSFITRQNFSKIPDGLMVDCAYTFRPSSLIKKCLLALVNAPSTTTYTKKNKMG